MSQDIKKEQEQVINEQSSVGETAEKKECQNNTPEYAELEKSKERISELEQEVMKFRNAAIQLKMDFESFKDIVDREKKNIEIKTKEDTLKKFIPVFEKFGISMKYSDGSDFAKAMEMIFRDFMNAFEKCGLTFIHPEKSDQFDPFEHEVIDKCETSEVSEYHVFETKTYGYKLNGTVLRAAQVVVAVKPKEKKEEVKTQCAEKAEEGEK